MARIVLLGPCGQWHRWVAETLLADGHTVTLGAVTRDDLSHFGALRLMLRQPGPEGSLRVQAVAAEHLTEPDHDISIILLSVEAGCASVAYPSDAPILRTHLTLLFAVADPGPDVLLQALQPLSRRFRGPSDTHTTVSHTETAQSTLLIEGDLAQLASWAAPALQALVTARADRLLLRVSAGRYLRTFIATTPIKHAIKPPTADALSRALRGPVTV